MIQNIVKTTNNLDFKITKWIHENVGLNKNPLISKAPYYLGLLPYELYVIPGMFIAIFTMFYDKSFNPIQFHLLPPRFWILIPFSCAFLIKSNFFLAPILAIIAIESFPNFSISVILCTNTGLSP